ncbi:MAG: phosphoribosylformylglycinamidine cyclo-ligase [Clostridiales bacterium]|jgi:phosphoribosylformylglycinamidine cyclo-ligase|nr:phosphoribosylformylglycinamidine cyclo-ligase [Clostridiales bacterium]
MDNYKLSGVDIAAGYESVDIIKHHVAKTRRDGVLAGIGGFAGLFSLAGFKHMQEPVLASGTDGVGTKLKIAFVMDKHDTVGIDCVAYSVNDIICTGAEPLYFLDYIACGKVVPEKVGKIVEGVALGCQMAGCALIGGETAEMPGFYPEDEYDLAGTAVGIIDKKDIIDGAKIVQGDVLIGIASSGLHSNGYSLVRKLLAPDAGNVGRHIAEFGRTLGEELLEPTKIYVKTILSLMENVEIKGICNITGGGFLENVPRMLPPGFCAKVKIGSWDVLPIFDYLKDIGKLDPAEMHNIFNMGVGMVIAVAARDCDKALQYLQNIGEKAYIIGEIAKNSEKDFEYV